MARLENKPRPDPQDSFIEEIAHASAQNWDRVLALAEVISRTKGGMRKLVLRLGNSRNPATMRRLAGCLYRWNEEIWKPRLTGALLVQLLKSTPVKILREESEVVDTLLSLVQRVSFRSYAKEDLPVVLDFVARHGIGNKSRLSAIIVPHACEIIQFAEKQGYYSTRRIASAAKSAKTKGSLPVKKNIGDANWKS